jgi:hypothetical protein
MTTPRQYKTGTASEAIGYTSPGTLIDWLDETKGILAFVVEAVPPCDDRWCENRKSVLREARVNARTASQFVQLASYGHLVDDERTRFWRLGAVFTCLAYCLFRRRQHFVQFLLRKCRRKEKQVQETELRLLTAH